MAACRPVIACNNGGPTESIVHSSTGFLCEPTAAAFAEAFAALLDEKAASKMGKAARLHVKQAFSRTAFGNKLHEKVLGLVSGTCNISSGDTALGNGAGPSSQVAGNGTS
jgi:alpha-1,3/alpha-1,6-mannosyltransferase